MLMIQKYQPQLRKKFNVLSASTYTSEGPGYKPGRRSRIGDMIVIVEGSKDFMEALRGFPEEFRFKVSPTWRLTIRGGIRKGQPRGEMEAADSLELSDFFRTLVMEAGVEDAMKKSKNSMKPDAPDGANCFSQ